MSGWAIVALVAILVWGVVQTSRARRGMGSRRDGDETRIDKADEQARREIEDLRERIKVLERIATDGNSLDANQTRQIAAEIEALRDRQDQ